MSIVASEVVSSPLSRTLSRVITARTWKVLTEARM